MTLTKTEDELWCSWMITRSCTTGIECIIIYRSFSFISMKQCGWSTLYILCNETCFDIFKLEIKHHFEIMWQLLHQANQTIYGKYLMFLIILEWNCYLKGKAECNIIMWMDHRAVDQTERINSTQHYVLKNTGGQISVEMEPPKLLWIKEVIKQKIYLSITKDSKFINKILNFWLTYVGIEGVSFIVFWWIISMIFQIVVNVDLQGR